MRKGETPVEMQDNIGAKKQEDTREVIRACNKKSKKERARKQELESVVSQDVEVFMRRSTEEQRALHKLGVKRNEDKILRKPWIA